MLKAGRELDKLIAEKVMGWNFSDAAQAWYPPNLHPLSNVLGHAIPSYSTDIVAAWKVVERLIKDGHACDVLYDHGWSCHSDLRGRREYGETAPHAICLAALAIVDQEGEE